MRPSVGILGVATAVLALVAASDAQELSPSPRGDASTAAASPASPSPEPAASPPAPATGETPASLGADRDAILRVQVALDRAAFSVGEIDGRMGANTARALRAFRRAHDVAAAAAADDAPAAHDDAPAAADDAPAAHDDAPAAADAATVALDDATARALASDAPTLVPYTLTAADVAGPFVTIPADMMAKAKLPASSYASPLEALAERVHASPALLVALNPGRHFDAAGETVLVPNVRVGPPAPAARIVVDGTDLSVTALDAAGKTIARYPASVGSAHDPLPAGEWTIKGVARNPPFHYNPRLFWDAKTSQRKATIAPGPNNPVGVVWIDLSKEHYGIHGTPEPSRISRSESHGCIRLTNWDATALAEQVRPGTPAVLRR